MADWQTKEATIDALPDKRWKELKRKFQGARDAQITVGGESFKELHEKHYGELLDKIIELSAKKH